MARVWISQARKYQRALKFQWAAPQTTDGSQNQHHSAIAFTASLPNQLALSMPACWCYFKAGTCVGGGPWYLRRNGTPRAHPRGPLGAGSLQNWAVKIRKGVFLTFLFLIVLIPKIFDGPRPEKSMAPFLLARCLNTWDLWSTTTPQCLGVGVGALELRRVPWSWGGR